MSTYCYVYITSLLVPPPPFLVVVTEGCSLPKFLFFLNFGFVQIFLFSEFIFWVYLCIFVFYARSF